MSALPPEKVKGAAARAWPQVLSKRAVPEYVDGWVAAASLKAWSEMSKGWPSVAQRVSASSPPWQSPGAMVRRSEHAAADGPVTQVPQMQLRLEGHSPSVAQA